MTKARLEQEMHADELVGWKTMDQLSALARKRGAMQQRAEAQSK